MILTLSSSAFETQSTLYVTGLHIIVSSRKTRRLDYYTQLEALSSQAQKQFTFSHSIFITKQSLSVSVVDSDEKLRYTNTPYDTNTHMYVELSETADEVYRYIYICICRLLAISLIRYRGISKTSSLLCIFDLYKIINTVSENKITKQM